jgi:hypothetical protein
MPMLSKIRSTARGMTPWYSQSRSDGPSIVKLSNEMNARI